MRSLSRILEVVIVILVASLDAEATVYNSKVHTLKNGLEVIVIENHRAPLAIHIMGFKVGTNESPWGKSGLAHYLEHLMFKGEPSSAAGKMMREVTRLGGVLNAQTSPTYTLYYEIIPVTYLEEIMKLDSERMSKLEIKDKWALPEIDVILEERHMRIDNTVMGKFTEQLNVLSIKHHPSRFPTIGWAHEIKNYTPEDAMNFYQKWYIPNNAFVVIAGDIRFDQAISLAEKYYGSIPAKPLPNRLDIQEPKGYDVSQEFEMKSELTQSPIFIKRYRAPTLNDGQKEAFYALIVLESLLGRPVTGRFTATLVEKKRLAARLSVDYSGLQNGPGTFQFIAIPSPDISLKELEKALAQELDKLIEKGITEEELQSTKNYIIADLVYTQDDITKAAQTLASLYGSGMPLKAIESWPEHIQAVTLKQVNRVIREVFLDSKQVTGRLIPKDSQSKE
jgi:zinc protease